jgi:hypothetical protein
VSWIWAQPARLDAVVDGRGRWHVPDFLLADPANEQVQDGEQFAEAEARLAGAAPGWTVRPGLLALLWRQVLVTDLSRPLSGSSILRRPCAPVPVPRVDRGAAFPISASARAPAHTRAAGRYRRWRRPLVIDDPARPELARATGGLERRGVNVRDLKPVERRRLP